MITQKQMSELNLERFLYFVRTYSNLITTMSY